MFDFSLGMTLHLGHYVSDAVDWMNANWDGFFEVIKSGLLWILLHLNDFLSWVPWWYFILVVFLLSCSYKSVNYGIFYSVFLFFIHALELLHLSMLSLTLHLVFLFIMFVIEIQFTISLPLINR